MADSGELSRRNVYKGRIFDLYESQYGQGEDLK